MLMLTSTSTSPHLIVQYSFRLKIEHLQYFTKLQTIAKQKSEAKSEDAKVKLPPDILQHCSFPGLLSWEVVRPIFEECHYHVYILPSSTVCKMSSPTPPDSETLEITIQTMAAKSFPVRIRRDSSIHEVKERIQSTEGIPLDSQRLILDGKKLQDDSTVGHYDIQDGSVLHLVLRLLCIASSQPASFGKYDCTPDHKVLIYDDIRKTARTEDALLVVRNTGGSLKLLPNIRRDTNALPKHSCSALIKYLDSCARACPNDFDLKLTLGRDRLQELIGEYSVQQLEKLFGARYDIIRVRRTVASDTWVPFHTDHSCRTMQVALNCEEDFEGGKLVFATRRGFVEPARLAGSATIHTSFVVHGVTKLRHGIRYGLFFCDLNGHYERKAIRYLVEATLEQLKFFERAVKFIEDLDDSDICAYIGDYARYMTLSNRTELPSLGVEVVWRSHLLSPMRYREFCERLGLRHSSTELVEHIPRDAERYPLGEPVAHSIQPTTNIRMDLVCAVKRQKEFMKQVLNMRDMRRSQAVAEGVEEYYKFLRQVGESNMKLEPSVVVDLVWHTHMLFPRRYEDECHLIVGRFVDHEVT